MMPSPVRLSLILSTLLACSSPALAQADAGATLFTQRCGACHANKAGAPNRMGPNLAGVVGRKAGSAQGYALYSSALKAFGKTWTPQELDQFLAAPMKRVPGTKMPIAIPDKTQRDAVIAYLATLR